jgi:hypothetical protein
VHLRWCFVCDYIDTGVIRLVQTTSPTSLRISEPRPVLLLSSSSIVLFFPVVFGWASSSQQSGFSLTRPPSGSYSLPCVSPLLCILACLSLGGVFDDSLIIPHITSH